MPELPEVEVVRRGLSQWVAGRTIGDVVVDHPRAVRRHEEGSADFVARLRGATVTGVARRGKYLWLPLSTSADDPTSALVGHLGMSGQLLVLEPGEPSGPHLRVRFRFTDGGRELRFVDQRIFGGLSIADLVDDGAGGLVPSPVAHIARDPLDPLFDEDAVIQRIRRRASEIKRVLLDQSVISGVGNIYADEALWRSRLHGSRIASSLSRGVVRGLIDNVREVMTEALRQGGTSFDSLYVDVNGRSGYFERSLAAYGQEGQPCPRCGTPIRRSAFMNRSSFWCPRCQRRPARRT